MRLTVFAVLMACGSRGRDLRPSCASRSSIRGRAPAGDRRASWSSCSRFRTSPPIATTSGATPPCCATCSASGASPSRSSRPAATRSCLPSFACPARSARSCSTRTTTASRSTPKAWNQPSPFTPVLRSAPHGRRRRRHSELSGAEQRFPPEARLYARSASDDKAPIIALLTAARRARSRRTSR